MKRPAAVLFDLDGTLLDTAPDLARALDRLRREQGLEPLPFGQVRPVVSHGATALIRLGFGLDPDAAAFESLRQRLLDLYSSDLAVETRPFPGIEALLAELEAIDLPWGVVTNKPAWLTDPLLRRLGLFERSACVVSGDTTAKRKPDPEPLLFAARAIGVAAAGCVYVGDAERDVEAGRRAGMRTVAARYGYLDGVEKPESWGADGLIDRPSELAGLWRQDAANR